MKPRLLIFGAGGHGRVVADAATACGSWSEVAFMDSNYPTTSHSGEWPVIGSDEQMEHFLEEYPCAVVAVGDNRSRMRLHNKVEHAGFKLSTVIHPAATVGREVVIGAGSVVFAGAVINHGARIGCSCIINTSASVDHDGILEDGVHLSPGAHLAGAVSVGELSWIGMGASVIQQVKIGKSVIVGAGAVVIGDVEDRMTVVGVPAKEMKHG